MSDEHLFDLQATHNPHRFYLPVEEHLTVGPPGRTFLFGGVGLASSITAMEQATGRPAVWAAAQYLSYARPGTVVDLDVIVPIHGKYNTQARVIGHVGDQEIFTVNAALGIRPSELSGQWQAMPEVPSPEECPPLPRWRKDGKDLHGQMDVRVVKGRYGVDRRDVPPSDDGNTMLWARPKGNFPTTSAMLSIIADFVPSGTGHALGIEAGANSLDNTIRIRRIVETEWVLCDIQIHGVHGGFVHGRMFLFAESGELMAIASQSGILRVFQPPRPD